MRTHISRLAIVSTVAAGMAALGPTYDAQALDRPTCHGKKATIVGTPGGRFLGTDHADVIVTNGASGRARAGDDLICMTGDVGTNLDAGPGRDVVDARALDIPVTSGTVVVLGTGADRYHGSTGRDVVVAGLRHHRRDKAHDVIVSGAGTDFISTGTLGRKDDDTIRTGGNADTVEVFGMPGGAHVDGGSAHNYLTPYFGKPRGHLAWDMTEGRMRLKGRTVAHVRHFEDVTFVSPPSRGLTIRHGVDNSYVRLQNLLGPAVARYDVDLHLGQFAHLFPAADVRLVGRAAARSHGNTLALTSRAHRRTTVDLDGWETEDGHRTVHLHGFDLVDVRGSRPGVPASIVGSGADENISVVTGGPVVLRGGGGVDILSTGDGPDHLYGGDGDDFLRAGDGDDVLRGGPGDDDLDGGAGTDRCGAELVTINCELPL